MDAIVGFETPLLVPGSALASSSGPSPLFGFLIKQGYRIPASSGQCVSLEFWGSVSFIGISVNFGLARPRLVPAIALASSSGIRSLLLRYLLTSGSGNPPYYRKVRYRRVRAKSPLYWACLNPGYRISASTGKCVSIEFGARVSFVGFW